MQTARRFLAIGCPGYRATSQAAWQSKVFSAGEDMRRLPHSALAHVWWPFTQHQGMTAGRTLTIDGRAGETLLTGEAPAEHHREHDSAAQSTFLHCALGVRVGCPAAAVQQCTLLMPAMG